MVWHAGLRSVLVERERDPGVADRSKQGAVGGIVAGVRAERDVGVGDLVVDPPPGGLAGGLLPRGLQVAILGLGPEDLAQPRRLACELLVDRAGALGEWSSERGDASREAFLVDGRHVARAGGLGLGHARPGGPVEVLVVGVFELLEREVLVVAFAHPRGHPRERRRVSVRVGGGRDLLRVLLGRGSARRPAGSRWARARVRARCRTSCG